MLLCDTDDTTVSSSTSACHPRVLPLVRRWSVVFKRTVVRSPLVTSQQKVSARINIFLFRAGLLVRTVYVSHAIYIIHRPLVLYISQNKPHQSYNIAVRSISWGSGELANGLPPVSACDFRGEQVHGRGFLEYTNFHSLRLWQST
jgi:hypothetical protein